MESYRLNLKNDIKTDFAHYFFLMETVSKPLYMLYYNGFNIQSPYIQFETVDDAISKLLIH